VFKSTQQHSDTTIQCTFYISYHLIFNVLCQKTHYLRTWGGGGGGGCACVLGYSVAMGYVTTQQRFVYSSVVGYSGALRVFPQR